MEYGVFLTPQVAPIMEKNLVEARLHTDGTKNLDRILELQEQFVGHRGLPVYIVLDPATGTVGGKLERIEGNPAEFAVFLKDALDSIAD